MNNQVVQLAEIVIGSFVSLGILSLGFGYAFGQWKKGGSEYSIALIANLKDLLASEQAKNQVLLKDKNESYLAQQAQINKLQTDLGKLQGTIETQTTMIDQYKELIMNRNPELEETLLDIRNFLKSISNMAVTVQLRNEALDSAITSEKK